MLHTIAVWITAGAFAVAGLNNSLGRAATKDDYIRWGYPAWWCYVTGALEFVTAALIAVRGTRTPGLVLGAVIIAAAVLTVLRRREFGHLPPLGVFAVLIAAAAATV